MNKPRQYRRGFYFVPLREIIHFEKNPKQFLANPHIITHDKSLKKTYNITSRQGEKTKPVFVKRGVL